MVGKPASTVKVGRTSRLGQQWPRRCFYCMVNLCSVRFCAEMLQHFLASPDQIVVCVRPAQVVQQVTFGVGAGEFQINGAIDPHLQLGQV